ncbi:MAG: hypothetical protein WBC13_02800, partial [Dokdonella sp.]
ISCVSQNSGVQIVPESLTYKPTTYDPTWQEAVSESEEGSFTFIFTSNNFNTAIHYLSGGENPSMQDLGDIGCDCERVTKTCFTRRFSFNSATPSVLTLVADFSPVTGLPYVIQGTATPKCDEKVKLCLEKKSADVPYCEGIINKPVDFINGVYVLNQPCNSDFELVPVCDVGTATINDVGVTVTETSGIVTVAFVVPSSVTNDTLHSVHVDWADGTVNYIYSDTGAGQGVHDFTKYPDGTYEIQCWLRMFSGKEYSFKNDITVVGGVITAFEGTQTYAVLSYPVKLGKAYKKITNAGYTIVDSNGALYTPLGTIQDECPTYISPYVKSTPLSNIFLTEYSGGTMLSNATLSLPANVISYTVSAQAGSFDVSFDAGATWALTGRTGSRTWGDGTSEVINNSANIRIRSNSATDDIDVIWEYK